MLLKGFRQKGIRVCAAFKGSNFDLQSPAKGHKNKKINFCLSKGQDFEPWAEHTHYFLTPVPAGYNLVKTSNELRLTSTFQAM